MHFAALCCSVGMPPIFYCIEGNVTMMLMEALFFGWNMMLVFVLKKEGLKVGVFNVSTVKGRKPCCVSISGDRFCCLPWRPPPSQLQ